MTSILPYLFISFALFALGIVVILSRKILSPFFWASNSSSTPPPSILRPIPGSAGTIWDGHVMTLFIIVVAAAEAAVGLALVIRFYQTTESIHVDDATQLQG